MKKLYPTINILLIALLAYLVAGIFKIVSEPDTALALPSKKAAEFELKLIDTSNPPALSDTLILNDCETSNDLYNLRNIEKNLDIKLNPEWRTHGLSSAEVNFRGGKYSELGIRYFPYWWDDYDTLSFDLYLKQGEIGSVSFRIGDFYSSEGYCAECQKYVQYLEIRQGENHFAFPLSEIRNKIDINSEFKSIHLGWKSLSKGTLYIDNIRLTKNAEQ